MALQTYTIKQRSRIQKKQHYQYLYKLNYWHFPITYSGKNYGQNKEQYSYKYL